MPGSPYPDPPRLQLPLRVDAGRLGALEQGTDEDIDQQAVTLLMYPKGGRDDLPEFGRPSWQFRNPQHIDPDEARAALEAFVPEAELALRTDVPRGDALLARVTASLDRKGGR